MAAAVFAITLTFLLSIAAILVIELLIKVCSTINNRKQEK